LYFFENDFETETIRKNFEFYEPLTVHESSLSPGMHSIVASKIGNKQKAYELYLRTARIDLDDYNNEVADGLHITSMAGTWLSIVKGFGGMRVKDDMLQLNPQIPEKWNAFAFNIVFRENQLSVKIEKKQLHIHNIKGSGIDLLVNNKRVHVKAESQEKVII